MVLLAMKATFKDILQKTQWQSQNDGLSSIITGNLTQEEWNIFIIKVRKLGYKTITKLEEGYFISFERNSCV